MTYKPPQIPHGLALETVADEYLSDYRRVYIEHPRLRLDGVYIAVCHYVCVHCSHDIFSDINIIGVNTDEQDSVKTLGSM
jgi:F-box protein 9